MWLLYVFDIETICESTEFYRGTLAVAADSRVANDGRSAFEISAAVLNLTAINLVDKASEIFLH
jgi:hypothetical protein